MEIQEKAGSFELGLEIGKRRVAVKRPSSKVRILETRWRAQRTGKAHLGFVSS